jgi:hypothetical protein
MHSYYFDRQHVKSVLLKGEYEIKYHVMMQRDAYKVTNPDWVALSYDFNHMSPPVKAEVTWADVILDKRVAEIATGQGRTPWSPVMGYSDTSPQTC